MYAVRNIRLCTKDCLCLYVCPTGATDTENGQVDASKCTGCGICAGACPSGAISMVPDKFPPQQPKAPGVRASVAALARSKAAQEKLAAQIASQTEDPVLRQLAEAVSRSNRLMAEDLLREAGYMLPQSANTHALLLALLEGPHGPDFPRDAVERLLELIQPNEAVVPKAEKWRCMVCGYIHEGPLPRDFQCPRCGQPASVFRKLED